MKNLYRIIILLFLTVPLFAGDVTICLRDCVLWDDEEIILGEIADIFGFDQLLVAQLSSLYIAQPPGKGESLRLTRDHIKRKIQLARFDTNSITYTGSYQTLIINEAGSEYKDNPLAQTVAQFLHRHFTREREEFSLHFRHIPKLDNAYRKMRFEVQNSPNQNYRGNLVIIVCAMKNGRIVKKFPVSVKVRTYQKVLVAKQSIDLRKPLIPDDFSLERRETTRLRENPVVSFEQIRNKQASRVIIKNSILTVNEIEPIPAIKRGDIILITVRTDNFYITAKGRARKAGEVGETIPVVNLSSLKEIDAVVIDSNTVVVNF